MDRYSTATVILAVIEKAQHPFSYIDF